MDSTAISSLQVQLSTKGWQNYLEEVINDSENTSKFVDLIFSIEYIEAITPDGRDAFIDLIQGLTETYIFPKFCVQHWDLLFQMISHAFAKEKYYVSLLISDMLVTMGRIKEIIDYQDQVSVVKTIEDICQYTEAIEFFNNNIFSVLCNMLKVVNESYSEKILSIYINRLNSMTCLITLSNMTGFLSNNKYLVENIVKNDVFWEKLMDCLECKDSSVRKRSLFFLNYIINSDAINLRNQDNKLADIFIVLETLEETQSHIIRPVLTRISRLYDFVAEGKLAIRWIAIIFNRLMSQESRMVSRWGMQLLLDLPPIAFRSEIGLATLERLLYPHLHSTYMYYRPNFIEKGTSPPVADLLQAYFHKICCDFDHSLSEKFLRNLFLYLGQGKVASTPLTFLTHILSEIRLPYKLCGSFLTVVSYICRVTLPTQPNKVKGAVQGFLLDFINNNIDHNDPEFLNCLQTLLDCMIIEYVLDGTHCVWDNLSSLIKFNIKNDTLQLECYISNQLKLQKNKLIKTTGFGLIIAMADKQKLLDEEILDKLLYPIKSCSTNMYISKSSVICAASTIDTVSKFFKQYPEQSAIISSCIQCSDIIFENCSWFLPRYCELVLYGDAMFCKMQHLEDLADLLVNLLFHNKMDAFKCEKLFANITKEKGFSQVPYSQFQDSQDFMILVSTSALLFKAFQNLCFDEVTMLQCFDDVQNLDFFVPFLQSNTLSLLENSWTCFCFLSQCMNISYSLTSVTVFNLAVESIQKMKSTQTILTLFDLIKHLTPKILTEDASLFNNSIPSMLTILLDFHSSGVYWNLLSSFCEIIFSPDVMNHPMCFETLIKTINDFKDLTSSKESVISHVANSLMPYVESNMSNLSYFLDVIMNLSLFGVTKTREKQNADDLMAYVDHLNETNSICYGINEPTTDVSFVRVQMINMLYKILEKFPEYSTTVVDFYVRSFQSFEKAALQNSLPNRTKVRISQALLCLLPVVLKNIAINLSEVNKLLDQIILLLALDSQPSVRCFIECCVCVVLSHHPHLIFTLFSNISDSKSNVFLVATFSIISHHIKYLHLQGSLTQTLLDGSMEQLSVWTCANNHNVRSFSGACLVMLAKIYSKLDWVLPQYYDMQVKFITSSKDYKKLFTNTISKNVYFTKFNVCNDLCLLNIFCSLPVQFSVLENECVNRRDLEKLKSYMTYPVVCGDFHLLPRPVSREHGDYLIRFDDLSDASVLQKKITPWQVMAINLGISFDRSSTPKGDLIVFASLVDKGSNLGGLARTAEIFGVKTITLNNMEVLNNRDFKSLSMTSEKWLNFEEVPYNTKSTVGYFKSKKREGYTIVGVEQASNSVSLEQFQFPEKSVLVLGRERDGIPVELLSHLDICVEIPQLGLVRSLNVHVSASIIIWEYSKQHLFNENNS